MKTWLSMMSLMCVLGLLAGCHSGTTRGIGADISKLGNSMQT